MEVAILVVVALALFLLLATRFNALGLMLAALVLAVLLPVVLVLLERDKPK